MTDVGEPGLVRAPSVEIERGTVLAGRYQIEAEIGKGGSGAVLRAFDRVAETPVAIKILRADLAADPRWVERFSRELRLGRQIQHANVCRIFDIGEADGHRFLTMELATGGTLRDSLDGPPRDVADRVSDARALISGLAAIHAAGIVHRDVKPENLLRMADGRLVLSDFGLATNPGDAPATTIMVGTPSYMAPEIAMGMPATPSSDVWAAGVVLHEILFGKRPERAKAGAPRRRSRASLGSRPSRIERSFEYLCDRCTADEPEDRPLDAMAIDRLLEAATTSPLRFLYRRRARRLLPAWGLIAAAAAVLAVGLAVRHRLWTPASASSTAAVVRRVAATGRAADWSASPVVASFEGRMHCLSPLPGEARARAVWGSPRRAEDVDLATGRRAPSPVPPETYRVDCPVSSPRDGSLLYTRAAGSEPPWIMLARPDGSQARPLTAGTEALWLPGGGEFLFNLDTSHVAVFSLALMNFRLLWDGNPNARLHVHEKALNARGDRAAIVYNDSEANRVAVVHALPGFEVLATWQLPRSMSTVGFRDEDLFLSDASEKPTLARFDWRSGTVTRLGLVPGASLLSLAPTPTTPVPGDAPLLLVQSRTSDVWLFDGGRAGRQLTTNGVSYIASRSASGDTLVQTRLDDGRFVIVNHDNQGRATRLTAGPSDSVPSYAPDGKSWVYTDYQRRVIRHCQAATCRDLWHEPLLPTWPVIAPDGQRLAFVTQIGTPRLRIVDMQGKQDRDLGPTATECRPVWSGPGTLWGFSGAGGERAWAEIDVATGRKSGRSKSAVGFDPDRLACGWEAEPPGSPFFQAVRPIVREASQIRRLRTLLATD